MLTYQQAERLAIAWVEIVHNGIAMIDPERIMTRPYGWVFCYQSKQFLAEKNFANVMVGNAPIIVDRIDGEIRITGTAKRLEDYLAEYEATLPAARLNLKPEFPPQAT